MELVLTLLIGAFGGIIGRLARIPGGSLLGAMVAVASVQLIFAGPLKLSPQWAVAGQVLVGAAIGSTMDRRMIASFRQVLLPGSLAVVGMLAGGVIAGATFTVLGFADPITALFGLSPGGFAEMTAAAITLGASGPLVASMHVVRVVMVLVLLPMLLRPLARRSREGGGLGM